jgi:hypothetical protein
MAKRGASVNMACCIDADADNEGCVNVIQYDKMNDVPDG